MMKAKECSPGGEITLMASLMTAPAQSSRLWDFFAAMKGGLARGPLQLNLYLSNLDHILFHRIRSNISEHLFQGKTSRFEWNREISQDISIRQPICTINGEVNENKFPKKELAVSWRVRPSSTESLFFSLTGRQRKIILLLRKENAFYHPIICEYKLLPE